ncbi:MAG: DedA family protein [Terriglobia bacterium]
MSIVHAVRQFLLSSGYWAVVVGLLGENAGLRLPGETVLISASYLASKGTSIHIQWITLAGTAAAVLDDNVGYGLGTKSLSVVLFALAYVLWRRQKKSYIERCGPEASSR